MIEGIYLNKTKKLFFKVLIFWPPNAKSPTNGQYQKWGSKKAKWQQITTKIMAKKKMYENKRKL